MKKDSRGPLIIFLVLASLVLIYFAVNSGDKRYQWNESFRAKSEQPYGTHFIQQILENKNRDGEFVLNNRKPLDAVLATVEDPSRTDYVFIGQDIFLSEKGESALAQFLEGGGTAFISTLNPPESLLEAVYFPECGAGVRYEKNYTEGVTMNFFHNNLRKDDGFRFVYRVGASDQSYDWSYFGDSLFCQQTRQVLPLGYQDGERVNFLGISVGKGMLYLHSNPLVFTNYFLVNAEKADYAADVFSHLAGTDMIWDEYSKIPFQGNANAYNSPLYYILAQPALKYAWWMLLFSVGLYVLFAARRKQRPIPVVEKKSNTSLEFVNLISRLHYKNGDHLDMARKKMRYFLYFVRARYGIHAERFRDEQIRRLSEKSRVNIDEVAVIFSQYYLIEEKFHTDIEMNRLVGLYDAIENFYNQCK